MANECQYLEYRPPSDGSDGGEADGTGDDRLAEDDGVAEPDTNGPEPRPYCTAADQFVQAMRADICNRRYGLDPETDCEFYRDAEGLSGVPDGEGSRSDGASVGRDGTNDARSDAAKDVQSDGTGGD